MAPAAVRGLGGTGISPWGWALRGLVLVGVSVVSGLLWLALTGGEGESNSAPEGPTTKHDFTRVLREDGRRKCADVSHGAIQEFFTEHGCEHLTRALYTTTLDDGRRVLTSVVAVRLSDSALVRELDELVTMDETGNIRDLVSDGTYHGRNGSPGLTQDVGFASERQGRLLVVGESGYFAEPDTYEDARLGRITRDALKLAPSQDSD